MKPILFNTEMVRAILEGRKTVTRRVVKPQPVANLVPAPDDGCWPGYFAEAGTPRMVCPPYRPGDILYVKETFWKCADNGDYSYKADVDNPSKHLWRPSIHMPREAARIFLRVTDVRVERLQKADGHEILLEGVDNGKSNPAMGGRWEAMQKMAFSQVWDGTLKPVDRARYGWDANPWVWVIKFERISREEAQKSC